MRMFKLYDYESEKVLYEIKGSNRGRTNLDEFIEHVLQNGLNAVSVRDKDNNDITNDSYVWALNATKAREVSKTTQSKTKAVDLHKAVPFKSLLRKVDKDKDLSRLLKSKLSAFSVIKIERPLQKRNLGDCELLEFSGKTYIGSVGSISAVLLELVVNS